MTYIDVIGEKIRSKMEKSDLPDEDARGLFRIYAVLLLAKGDQVNATDVHNAWVAWMTGKNPVHEALVPHADLPSEVAKADVPYVDAIRAVAEEIQP